MRTAQTHDVILATHYWTIGPASALDQYLKHRTTAYLYIAHPLFGGMGPAIRCQYRDGVEVNRYELPGLKGPSRYVRDVILTVRWAGRHRYDIFIAGDNLLALAGLWLRWRGRAQSVILYSIDFVPRRFANPILNWAYHRIDRFAARHVDLVWNAAEAIGQARRQRDHGKPMAPDIVVPVGAWVHRIRRLPLGEVNKHLIVHVGHLLEKQGMQCVIEAMPLIRARVPDAKLLVIGDGPYMPALNALAERCGVAEFVEFAGATNDHLAVEERLVASAVGVATYVPDPSNYSQYTDLPGKVKNYLACGLAVVMTDVPAHARLVEVAGAGRVVQYTPEAVADAIIRYLTNPEELERARAAAVRVAQPYDWDLIFDKAFASSVDNLTQIPAAT